ncbi:hypothetical protein ACV35H_32400, partial [Pseudomonas aeruginosa]
VTSHILGFAHTVGEFGVVLMNGGNMPEKTRVVSVQIFDHVEAMEFAQAHWLAGGMVAFSLVVLLALYSGRRRRASHVGLGAFHGFDVIEYLHRDHAGFLRDVAADHQHHAELADGMGEAEDRGGDETRPGQRQDHAE